jgi:6-phosphogluconolactonase
VQLIVEQDAAAAAQRAAAGIEAACRDALRERGLAVIACSGGQTPWLMLERLREAALPWQRIHVAQVDERIVSVADPRRNLTRLRDILVAHGPLPEANLMAMPVEDPDPDSAVAAYQSALEARAGTPLRLDLVHLGLGEDGHTASLIPGDPVLEIRERDVAVSQPYQGIARMTLTYPALDRARARLWLVTGDGKRPALQDLLSGQGTTPAARVLTDASMIVTDISTRNS